MSKYNLDTKDDFLFEVQIRLATMEVRDEVKRVLWKSAQDMANNYKAAKGMGLASMFLSSLEIDPPPVLYASTSVEEKLPESVFTSYMSVDDAEYKRKVKNRNVRIGNIVNALESGWEDREAIAFAAAKDEWREAKKLYSQKQESGHQSGWGAQ